MFDIGEKVIINIPIHAGFIKNAPQKRHFNHRIATICSMSDDKYILNIDDGMYKWEPQILGRVVGVKN